MASPQQAPLKGGVNVTIEKPFDDIVTENGGEHWWNGLAPATQQEVLNQYDQEFIAPAFQKAKASPQAYQEAVQQFRQDWTAPPVQEAEPQSGIQNLFNAYQQGVNNFGNAALNPETYTGLANQAAQAALTEFQNRIKQPQNIQDAAIQGISNTPFAFAPGAISAVRDLAQGALSLPADIANAYQGRVEYQPAVQLPEVLPEFRQQFPVTSFIGEQAPYLIPFGKAAQASKLGKLGEIGKAAAEGAAIGGILDSQGQGLQGRVNNALMGGALPAVLGGAGGAVAKFTKPKAQFKLQVAKPSEGMQNWLKAQNAAEMAARAEQQALQEQLQRIGNTQKLTPEGTQQSQLSQFDTLYGKLSQAAADKGMTPQQRAVYGQFQGRVREQARPLQEAKAQASASKKAKTKAESRAEFLAREDIRLQNKLTTLEKQIAGRERIIQSQGATVAQKAQAAKDLAKHKSDLASALEEQKYRNKQALQAQKPAPKQRGQAAKNAAPVQAKPVSRTVLNPAKKAGNVERIQREKALPGLEAVKDQVEVKRRPEIIKKAEQSYLNNEKVKLDYMAEKAGTEIDKPTSDGVVITGIKQAKDKSVFLTAIDSEGQFRSYKLFDGKGDSLLNDIKPTGKKADFELVRDLEDMTKANTGRQRVLNTKTNELTEIFKPGETAKSSEIAAAREKIMDVAERLKSGEKVSTREIVDTAKRVDQDTFKKQFENLTQEQINQIGKDLGC